MGFDDLLSKADALVQRMLDDGYAKDYVKHVSVELNWLRKNGDGFDSYESACLAREAQTESPGMKGLYRTIYALLKRFGLRGEYPDFGMGEPLFKHGVRYRLVGEYADVIAAFESAALRRGLAEGTIRVDAANASCFLLAMQERGLSSLAEIAEDDALSFFTDDAGDPVLSHSYAKNIRAVLVYSFCHLFWVWHPPLLTQWPRSLPSLANMG